MMNKTNLLLAIRHLRKHRSYAFINIAGLSIGIAACLLMFRIVRYELSFDTFHRQYDRIVRVVTHDWHSSEGEDHTRGIPVPAMDEVAATVTAFEQVARVRSAWPVFTVPGSPGSMPGAKYATDDERENMLFTEPAFFRIFDWTWLGGTPEDALTAPNNAVLSRTWAEKCFGSWQAALGKTLIMDNLVPLTVKGVVEDAPSNSDFQVNVFVSYPTVRQNADAYSYSTEWGSTSSNDQLFALLRDPGQATAAAQALAQVGQAQYNTPDNQRKHEIQPLADIHFAEFNSGAFGTHTMEKDRLMILTLIGAMVLLMACFNFVNLATAQAGARAREVGVRKAIGGSRWQLSRQFMAETGVIVAIALAIGAFVAVLSTPLLALISDVPAGQPFLSDPLTLLLLGVIWAAVTLLSGFYPAVILSGFDPVDALKNSINQQHIGGVSLRKILVTGQFVAAQALIIGAVVTISQMDFLKKMDLGFSPDLVYVLQGVSTDSVSIERQTGFKARVLELPGVTHVSWSSDAPASNNNWSGNFALGGSNDAPFPVFIKFTDPDFVATHGLRIVAGRAINESDSSRQVLVNVYLLKKLGIQRPEDALGQLFRLGSRSGMTVVGVMDDFTANTARDEMRPMVLLRGKRFYSTVSVKLKPEQMSRSVADIERIFNEMYPEQVFNGEYMDSKIAAFYRDEARFSALCKGFALLAVFISCLGLYGLAALMSARRTKEIGVRKVLGAGTASLVGLLSREFMILVGVAAVIAVPLAYYFMDEWLSNFTYRTALSWWIFAGTVFLAGAVALLTVGIKAWSAASSNPVQALRSE